MNVVWNDYFRPRPRADSTFSSVTGSHLGGDMARWIEALLPFGLQRPADVSTWTGASKKISACVTGKA